MSKPDWEAVIEEEPEEMRLAFANATLQEPEAWLQGEPDELAPELSEAPPWIEEQFGVQTVEALYELTEPDIPEEPWRDEPPWETLNSENPMLEEHLWLDLGSMPHHELVGQAGAQHCVGHTVVEGLYDEQGQCQGYELVVYDVWEDSSTQELVGMYLSLGATPDYEEALWQGDQIEQNFLDVVRPLSGKGLEDPRFAVFVEGIAGEGAQWQPMMPKQLAIAQEVWARPYEDPYRPPDVLEYVDQAGTDRLLEQEASLADADRAPGYADRAAQHLGIEAPGLDEEMPFHFWDTETGEAACVVTAQFPGIALSGQAEDKALVGLLISNVYRPEEVPQLALAWTGDQAQAEEIAESLMQMAYEADTLVELVESARDLDLASVDQERTALKPARVRLEL